MYVIKYRVINNACLMLASHRLRERLSPTRRLFSRYISKIECIKIALFTREGATGAAVRDRTLHDTRPRYSVLPHTRMSVNPNFFPNGYQDPMHPEEEVVTNWPWRAIGGTYSQLLAIHVKTQPHLLNGGRTRNSQHTHGQSSAYVKAHSTSARANVRLTRHVAQTVARWRRSASLAALSEPGFIYGHDINGVALQGNEKLLMTRGQGTRV
ncbi:hypothetical protein MSG28_007323 [Choristoneura fumiferana]|uniref:Uncharacterized protein n=1 Tax=Choristoneura fumiferana TaxID=7141 RepID=A0ACC0JX60_CHOFU|nr:hypothetical protein MSG28_007323 [Choristoneura fumiferana]